MSRKYNQHDLMNLESNQPLWPTSMLSELFNDHWFGNFSGFGGFGSFRTDVRETADAYVIEAEMPGLAKDNVEINLDDGVLTITAHMDENKEEKGENGRYIRRERRTGSYCRSFSMDNVQTDQLKADMKNGVLTITCPKATPGTSQSRRIEIE
ncbi:MAG TPA: Hsp20/alpha crystallin family protein [Firmicutes bacterium]|nr:Hsp20/alpha crystallin family protein [Bacillota bacterium]